MEKKQDKEVEVKVKTNSVADQIWEDIRDREINMFTLPGQIVEQYCEFIKVEPSKCYLTTKVSAVLPALEEALKGEYTVDRVDRFLVVEKKVDKYSF